MVVAAGAAAAADMACLPAACLACRGRGAIKSNCGKENYFVSQKKIDGRTDRHRCAKGREVRRNMR